MLPNRLAKAAMSEHMADWDLTPGAELARLYEQWSLGGSGLLLTGNVMIDHVSREAARNVVLEDGVPLEPFRNWAEAGTAAGNHLWLQLNHPGRQTPRAINRNPVGPSAAPAVRNFRMGRFGAPRALTDAEIIGIVARYARAAELAREVGFTGVQIHGAHGYLIAQFLSPLTNLRTDRWGGPLLRRAEFARQVVVAVRDRVGPDFPIAIKLNSADFQRGGFGEDDALAVMRLLAGAGIDLIEISGGTYETQAMLGVESAERTRDREAYFLDFARTARRETTVPLMVTGGFRTATVMAQALAERAVDVVGLGRPLAADPALSDKMLRGTSAGWVSPRGSKKSDPIAEGGFAMAQMFRMGRGLAPDPTMGTFRITRAILGRMMADHLIYRARRRTVRHR
ncbi:NADH:flavin oxidoreductase/NADH oxidase family protein [Nocardia sp. NPDC051832]|uniref:NADH:flavin oxidoreductase/NADH oxidase family protein n=1 Tax=Nocardia sp. NPDC051832 TaxID=3155673 RepID=UPI0034233352